MGSYGLSRRLAFLLAAAAFAAGALLPRPARHAPAPPAPRPPAAADAAGPSATRDGVPAGFARSRAGAVAAAVAYVTTGQALLDMDPLSAAAAVRRMAAAASAERLAAETAERLRAVRAALAGGTGPVIYRQGVLAHRLLAYGPSRARVVVWHVGVLAREGVAPPQAGWATSTFELVWEAGDWRVLAEEVVPGPAPILDASAPPATAAQLAAALDGFEQGAGR